MWLLFAFSGPVLWAISTHIDKYLVEKYFRHSSVAVLLVFTSLIGAVMLPLIRWYQPHVLDLSAVTIAVIMASGILSIGSMLFDLQALQTEEASAVAPWFQAAQLFGYLLAYLFLGETLSARQIAPAKAAAAGKAAEKPAKVELATLRQLASAIGEAHGLSQKQANEVLAGTVALIGEHLKKGRRIRIAGLGTLEVRKRSARMGRKPATGEAIEIKASKKVAFRAAKDLSEAI
jgi:DNA-binding protein HU-beta